jgi:hypothetical protein
MERFIMLLQTQNRSDFPAITQPRYCRRFDFRDESTIRDSGFQRDNPPEGIQSARGLFEYASGDHDTTKLDKRQTLLSMDQGENSHSKHMLVVDNLWLIIFPESGTGSLLHQPPLLKSLSYYMRFSERKTRR